MSPAVRAFHSRWARNPTACEAVSELESLVLAPLGSDGIRIVYSSCETASRANWVLRFHPQTGCSFSFSSMVATPMIDITLFKL